MNSDLEIPDKHPLWRAPETVEEVAQFIANSDRDRKKEFPGTLFCGDDEKYEYATDGAVAYRAPYGTASFDEPLHTEPSLAKNIDGVLSMAFGTTRGVTEAEIIKVPYERLVQTLLNHPTVKRYETNPCATCDGRGRCRCSDCGHAHDCPHCDGEGEIVPDGAGTERMIYAPVDDFHGDTMPVQVTRWYYQPKYLSLFLGLGADEISLFLPPHRSEDDGSGIRNVLVGVANTVEISIMPYYWNRGRGGNLPASLLN
jgi:CDGSH-type Zn-finger protein